MTQIESTREYTVLGMTCAHCVRSVTEETVRAAVAEAGYEVAS